MKILIIDNNDSFTYNIAELIRSVIASTPRILPSLELDINDLNGYNKIILSPGPGLPREFPILAQTLERYANRKHILGICLGHQAVCEFFGARLANLPTVVHGQPRKFFVKRGSQLYKNMPNEFIVGLYHSWIVENSGFPKELCITGLSEDGNIMAVEHERYKIYGMQFHPESFMTEYGKQLMTNFLNI